MATKTVGHSKYVKYFVLKLFFFNISSLKLSF